MTRTSLSLFAVLACSAAFGQPTEPCSPQRIEPPAGTPPEKFGSMVATNGQFWFVADAAARTLCGGSTFECSTGAVHVYELINGQLEFTQTLVPPDIGLGSGFGAGMAAQGDRLIIGAPWYTAPGGVPRRGMLVEYGFDGMRWIEANRIEPPPRYRPISARRLCSTATP